LEECEIAEVDVALGPPFDVEESHEVHTNDTVVPLSPGACTGLSLKLKKIGSSWKPVAESEAISSSDAEFGEENCTNEGEDVVSSRSAPKKKKHKHHREADDNASDEERKLLKKRKKLLKRLKKSLKRQEELERAVEQSSLSICISTQKK
jgi:hypothetical protein